MYYEYAYAKAEKVSELRNDLYGATVGIVGSDRETEED